MRERSQPIMEHLSELRTRIFKAAIAVVVGTIVAFIFRDWIFDILVAPYERVTNTTDLAFFRPTEAFSLFMRISVFGGFILASPIVIYQIWAFVAPALSKREKRIAIPVVALLALLFIGGVSFGYWSLERGLGFLLDFGGDSLDPVIGGDSYLTFAIRFLLVFGIAFEFPVFLYATAAVGVVGWRQLAAGRRWAVLLIVTWLVRFTLRR
jgi:sec-independent protein translocase protein TatC